MSRITGNSALGAGVSYHHGQAAAFHPVLQLLPGSTFPGRIVNVGVIGTITRGLRTYPMNSTAPLKDFV